MRTYRATVTESVLRDVEYVVRAHDEDEAMSKMWSGDTVSETVVRECHSVTDRQMTGSIELLEDDPA